MLLEAGVNFGQEDLALHPSVESKFSDYLQSLGIPKSPENSSETLQESNKHRQLLEVWELNLAALLSLLALQGQRPYSRSDSCLI
jgi:hypothetical protein